MEFSGRLAAFPPSDLLQWARNDARTGALVLRRAGRTKRIYLERGNVVACLSDDPAEYYGQLLLLHGYIGEDDLLRALEECRRSGVRLGVALRELGLMTADEVQRTLRLQIEDAVCDVFLWRGGFFYFEEDEPPVEEILPEPIDSLRLAMEGARWIDEHERIRRVFVHDNIVLCPGAAWETEGLTPLQERLRAAIDGRANLEELYRRVHGSWFRFLDAAYGLAVAEVVDIQAIGDETPGRDHETGVFQLLLQQATEETVAAAQRQTTVPLDVLERLFPLWTQDASDAPSSAIALGFLRRCDGSLPLEAVFSPGIEERKLELETLLLTLRQGHIALLPEAVSADGLPSGPPIKSWWRRLVGGV